MPRKKEYEPPPGRYRELCSKPQREKDPKAFQSLLTQIERVLTRHEKKDSHAA